MSSFLKAKLAIYQTEEEIGKALFQLSIYTVFTIVTTAITLASPSIQVFFFSEYLDSQFLSIHHHESNFKYDHIITIEEWLDFTELNYLADISVWKANNRILKIGDTFVLSVPRMRQIRVVKEKCVYHPKLRTHFEDCYPSYSYANEDTAPFHKSTPYLARNEFTALPHYGNAETYNGPGYVKFLSFDSKENAKWFKEIEKTSWIDNGTRLVLIEMMCYNIDTLLFASLVLSAEILPTGSILPNWKINMIPMETIWSPNKPAIFFASIVFYLLVIYYTSVEIQELLESGGKKYFSAPQNYIDLIILVTAYLMLSLSMERPFLMNDFLESIMNKPTASVSLDTLYFRHMTFVCSMAICVFLVWAKILRFIGFNMTMLQFRTTLVRCTKDILGFALMFMIVFVAFALYGMLIFGSSRQNFNSIQNALFSMVRMVLGDFQYREIEYTNRILCPLFYIFYILFISFILLNMFLAIINNTYIYVKQEITEGHNVLRTFFINIFKRIKEKIMHSKKKRNEDVTSGSNAQDDTLSMFEFADVTLSNVASGRRDSILYALRRPFQQPYVIQDGRPSMEDNINETLIRLSERVELLEDLLLQMQANMDRIFGRTPS